MSTLTEQMPVTLIEATGPVTKTGKSEWSFPVVMTLADGRTLDSMERFGKMRDAKADLAAHPKRPTNITATEYQPDKWLFTINYWIGPARLRPDGY